MHRDVVRKAATCKGSNGTRFLDHPLCHLQAWRLPYCSDLKPSARLLRRWFASCTFLLAAVG